MHLPRPWINFNADSRNIPFYRQTCFYGFDILITTGRIKQDKTLETPWTSITNSRFTKVQGVSKPEKRNSKFYYTYLGSLTRSLEINSLACVEIWLKYLGTNWKSDSQMLSHNWGALSPWNGGIPLNLENITWHTISLRTTHTCGYLGSTSNSIWS